MDLARPWRAIDRKSAITGDAIAQAGNDALDYSGMLGWAREVGGPALRKMTFHDRARMLKALALHLKEHRQSLYDLSYDTGAHAVAIT